MAAEVRRPPPAREGRVKNLYPRVQVKCRCGYGVLVVRPPSSRARRVRFATGPHRALSVARLRMAGWTLRRLSVANGLPPTCLANTLRRTFRRGEEIIAACLNCEPKEIWPARHAKGLGR